MCFNKRVVGGLAVVALGVLLFYPKALGAALPVLVLAACPLSMIFMMRRSDGAQCATRQTDSGIARPADEEIRELRDEINILRAELRLRDGEPRH